MKLTKRKEGNYFLVKLNARDGKYLEDFRKYEHPKTVKNTDRLFSDKLALEIKTLWVMSTVMELESNGELSTEKVDEIFEQLDEPMNEFAQVASKYIKFLSRYDISEPTRKMQGKTEIIDVRKLLRRKYEK